MLPFRSDEPVEVKPGEGPLGDGGRELALSRPLSRERGLHGRRETTAVISHVHQIHREHAVGRGDRM
jgi:hypothetical protein